MRRFHTNTAFILLYSCCAAWLFLAASLPQLTSANNNALFLFSSAASSNVTNTIVLGHFRVPGIEGGGIFNGFDAALRSANLRNIAPGYTFVLESYVYPHCDNASPPRCDMTAPMLESGLRDFIGNMSHFHAVVSPSNAVSPLVVLEAKRLGIPLFNPLTVLKEDFETENIFHSCPTIETELTTLIKYMFTAHSCARTGIIHEKGLPGMGAHLEYIRNAFMMGGYPPPEAFELAFDTPPATFRSFFFDEGHVEGDGDGSSSSGKTCFICLTTGQLAFQAAGILSSDARYAVGTRKLFLWSYGGKSIGDSLGTALRDPATAMMLLKVLIDLYYPLQFPSLWNAPPRVLAAFNADYDALIATNPAFYNGRYVGGRVFPFMAYLTIAWLIEVYAKAAARHDLSDPQAAWAHFITTAYDGGDVLVGGDFPYARPIRQCFPKPMTGSCQCSTVSRFSYVYSVDLTEQWFVAVADNVNEGQFGATSTYFHPNECSLNVTAETFPVPMLLVSTPSTTSTPIVDGGLSVRDLYFSFVRSHNQRLADAASSSSGGSGARRRVISQALPAAIAAADANVTVRDAYLRKLTDTYGAFVLLGTDTAVGNTKKAIRTLTMGTNGTFNFPLTDPPLRPRPQWDEKLVSLSPTFADYAHALAGYIAASTMDKKNTAGGDGENSNNLRRGSYASLHVAATGAEEAALLVHSLNTFQIPVSTRDVFVSGDAAALSTYVSRVASQYDPLASGKNSKGRDGDDRPFILVGVYRGGSAADGIAVARSIANSLFSLSSSSSPFITLGLVASDAVVDAISIDAQTAMPMNTAQPSSAVMDIVFPSVFSEWWLEGSPLREAMASLGAPMDRVGDRLSYYAPTLRYSIADQLATMRAVGSTSSTSTTQRSVRTAAEVLYTARTASFADVPIGPFSNDTCSADVIAANAPERSCQCSKGLRLFRVLSMRDWQEKVPSARTGRFVHQMSTCGVKYSPLMAEPSSDRTAMQIALGVGVGGGLLLALLASVLVFVLVFSGRSNRRAPKDSTRPFSMAFTDIQSSTTLWARCPAIMSEAVEHHSAILRQLIDEYSGYEVKTIGDSFMVAFKRPEDAALFAVNLQTRLYADDGWPAELDQHYREMLLEACAGEGEEEEEGEDPLLSGDASTSLSGSAAVYGKQQGKDPANTTATTTTRRASNVNANNNQPPPNAPLDTAEYDALWHGLRVRVGLHYGLGEIRKDPITQGYDYYGTIVNTAARVEGVGHGGQTLVTDAVVCAIGLQFIEWHQWSQVSLGLQLLRGLDDTIVLVQLLPPELSGRRFPPLRLDVEKTAENEGGEEEAAAAHDESAAGKSSTTRESCGSSLKPTPQLLESMALALCADSFKPNRQQHQQAKRQHQHFTGMGGGGGGATVAAEEEQLSFKGGAAYVYAPSHASLQTTTNTHAAMINTHQSAAARSNVLELLHQYYFLSTLLSTTKDPWRRETLKYLATRWRVNFNSSNSGAPSKVGAVGARYGLPEEARCIMQMALKAMLAQRAAGGGISHADRVAVTVGGGGGVNGPRVLEMSGTDPLGMGVGFSPARFPLKTPDNVPLSTPSTSQPLFVSPHPTAGKDVVNGRQHGNTSHSQQHHHDFHSQSFSPASAGLSPRREAMLTSSMLTSLKASGRPAVLDGGARAFAAAASLDHPSVVSQ